MTKIVMAASAVLMAVAGLAGSFLPQELLRNAGLPVSSALAVAVQLYASLLLGFAMVNWMAKDSLIGGIYNRPVAIGNLLHFVSGALALLKYRPTRPAEMIVAAVYVLFAIAFARILFTSPVKAVPPEP